MIYFWCCCNANQSNLFRSDIHLSNFSLSTPRDINQEGSSSRFRDFRDFKDSEDVVKGCARPGETNCSLFVETRSVEEQTKVDRCCGRCSFSQKRIHGKSLKAINRGRFISGVRRSIVAAGIALLPLGRKKQRGATRLDRNSRVVHFSRDNEKVSLARERKDVNGRERIKQAKKKSELKRVES